MTARTVAWFSCGAASAVAAKLILKEKPAVIAYCETGSEHPFNARFMDDCEQWLGVKIERIKSEKYADTWDVWEKRKYLASMFGAPCTDELKVKPRAVFQRPDDLHIFGYTADAADVARAKRMVDGYPEMKMRFPLIERGLDKAACIAVLQGAGLEVPPMYALEFQNNNCIPCVKATSPAYWALVRREFPAQFERMAKLSRDLGVRLTRINDERVFIDEIPADWPTTNPIAPACDFLCHIAELDMA